VLLTNNKVSCRGRGSSDVSAPHRGIRGSQETTKVMLYACTDSGLSGFVYFQKKTGVWKWNLTRIPEHECACLCLLSVLYLYHHAARSPIINRDNDASDHRSKVIVSITMIKIISVYYHVTAIYNINS
jgi:hypothetical protein